MRLTAIASILTDVYDIACGVRKFLFPCLTACLATVAELPRL
jgi:hypothetical protein